MPKPKDQKQLSGLLGYEFKDEQLFTLALTHRSKQKNQFLKSSQSTHQALSYERLEFLGDSVLGMVMAKHLYLTYPDKQEGKLTRMRATLVREETLVKVASKFQLGKYLILGAGEVKAGGRQRDSILADVVEAIIGAIYLDCDDIHLVENLVLKWFKEPLKHITAIDTVAKLKDNKSRLQEYLQANKHPLPTYNLLKVKGKAPNEVFSVVCEVRNEADKLIQSANAEGKSRRIAEQNAAKIMLEKLQE